MTAPVSVDLEALSQLAQEAAKIHPGPWKVDPENGTDVLATMGGLDDVIMAEFGGKPFHSATPEFAALFAACSPDVVLSLVADANLGRLAREVARTSRVLATVHADFGWGRKRSAAYADFSDAETALDRALAADLEARQ